MCSKMINEWVKKATDNLIDSGRIHGRCRRRSVLGTVGESGKRRGGVEKEEEGGSRACSGISLPHRRRWPKWPPTLPFPRAALERDGEESK
jgi:hypothetical protein